ncbi:STE/STE20/FRAY protein kinase [Mycena kentingensis (nom. inval.)]|nr:STE/STE20/FRAY protein kinase [Mycena kentingensis (nom. inval.)]
MAPTPDNQPTPSSSSKAAKMFIGAVKDEWAMFSDRSSDYTVGAPIGFGASSIVYAAEYTSETGKIIPCALKVLDLDKLPPHSLALLQRETTLMSLSKHPNVLRVRGSWMDGHKLYIALRLMNRGSAADVMRYGWPGGMEEEVIQCILKQALEGLNYLHQNSLIHRDLKAANFLIDDDGTVLLGDLGVAADLAEDTSKNTASQKRSGIVTAEAAVRSHSAHSGKRISFDGPANPAPTRKVGKRKSFVGTPCWMAPEVIEARHYDSSADIWSFGITALELAQGRPPRSRDTPQRVLIKIIQEEPPTLDRDGGTHKYSRSFKEFVDSCLVKDPTKRPTAHELLQSPFLKSTKKKSYLVNAILNDLPPLAHRQERRITRGASAHNTIDSWNFSTVSPHSTRQAWLDQDSDIDGVFAFDGVGSGSDHSRRRSSHSNHSIPFHDEVAHLPEVVPEAEELELDPELDTSSASSPPSSDVDGAASASSMSSPAPSSPAISPDTCKGEPAASALPPPTVTSSTPNSALRKSPPVPVPIPTTPNANSKSPTYGSLSSTSSATSSRSHSPAPSSGVSSSPARSSSGIWKKIKGAGSGLRRVSGR